MKTPTTCAVCLEEWDIKDNGRLGNAWTHLLCGREFHQHCVLKLGIRGIRKCPVCFEPLIGGTRANVYE